MARNLQKGGDGLDIYRVPIIHKGILGVDTQAKVREAILTL